jgi:pimeloyl-ACP methyl ester carboxylesterase
MTGRGRAGVTRWPTAAGMARELHELLQAGGMTTPFVLAGHSLGGPVARVFTRLYPDEVVGLALVDSSHPEQQWRLPKTELRDHRGGQLAEAALDFARPLGRSACAPRRRLREYS